MERCGRRPLLLVGMALMAISMLLLTLALVFQEAVPWLSYISIVVTILYVIGFAVGLGNSPYSLFGYISPVVFPLYQAPFLSSFQLSFSLKDPAHLQCQLLVF